VSAGRSTFEFSIIDKEREVNIGQLKNGADIDRPVPAAQ